MHLKHQTDKKKMQWLCLGLKLFLSLSSATSPP